MSPTTTRAAFAVAAAFALAALPAHAQYWRMFQSSAQTWTSKPNNDVTCVDPGGFAHLTSHTMYWYLNPTGAGAGKDGVIKGALKAWTDVANADFDLRWGGYTSTGYQQSDGINTMVWGTGNTLCDDAACHAITALLLGPGQVIREADILFNADPVLNFQWMTNGEYSTDPDCWETKGSSGLKLDTQGIATHELGHAMGIAHPTNAQDSLATMGVRACTAYARTLESDDRAALACSEDRYPVNPAYQGAFESAGCKKITGWAWNVNRSYQHSYVEIVEDFSDGRPPRLHGVTQANLARTNIPPPDPYHGFSFTTPNALKDGRWHLVRGRYSNGASVGSSELMICGLEMLPRNMFPSEFLPTNNQPYEVGTTFRSDDPGYITQIGYFFAQGEVQAPSHTVRLWAENGQELAHATIQPPVVQPPGGWNYASIGRVPIQAGVNYRASVDTYLYQSKSPCGSINSLSSPYVNSPLTALGGVWRTGVGQAPNVSSCSNFFVSVTYESG